MSLRIILLITNHWSNKCRIIPMMYSNSFNWFTDSLHSKALYFTLIVLDVLPLQGEKKYKYILLFFFFPHTTCVIKEYLSTPHKFSCLRSYTQELSGPLKITQKLQSIYIQQYRLLLEKFQNQNSENFKRPQNKYH